MPIEDLYDGDGSTRDRVVTFPYTARSFVIVKVGGVLQVDGTDYVFFSDTIIRFDASHIPPSGTDNISFKRVTSTTPLIDFVAGASILDSDLDTSIQQMNHLSQEQASESFVDAAVAQAEIDADVTVSDLGADLIDDETTSAMRSTLGSTSVGDALFVAASGSAALQAQGVTSYEDSGIRANSSNATHQVYHGINLLTPTRNFVINSDFQVWQRNETHANLADGFYFADQWIGIANGVTPDWEKTTSSLPVGAQDGAKLTTNNSNVKVGFWQPIEKDRTTALREATITLSIDCRVVSGTLTDFRIILLSSTLTANDTDQDPISAWNAATAKPTPTSSIAFPSPTVTDADQFTATGSWATYSATFVVPVGANNLGFMIVSNDSSHTSGAVVDFSKAKLEESPVPTPYFSNSFIHEKEDCKRFYQKSFLDGVPAGNNVTYFGALQSMSNEWGSATAHLTFAVELGTMVLTPFVSVYNPGSGTSGRAAKVSSGGDSASLTRVASTERVFISVQGNLASLTADSLYYVHFVALALITS